MDARFVSMDVGERRASGCVRRAVATAGALASAAGGAVAGCLRSLRQPQFDEEHQRSLLSCHVPEELGAGSPPPAMVELRRRVMLGDAAARWKQRKRLAKAKAEQEAKAKKTTAKKTPAKKTKPRGDSAARLSDATLAIDELLGTRALPTSASLAGVRLEDVRRLSVDELLALTPAAETLMVEEEEEEKEEEGEKEGERVRSMADAGLRAWLSGIDAARAGEYCAYAARMEQLGFRSLADLARLDERAVEAAMSEVGVAKFAHRLRLRKAIRELHLGPAAVAAS